MLQSLQNVSITLKVLATTGQQPRVPQKSVYLINNKSVISADTFRKALSDIVESYIGAIFVDSEFDFKQVERFFEDHIRWFFEDMSIYDTFANNHPVTHLTNLLTNSFGCANFRILAKEIPDVDGSTLEVVSVVLVHETIAASASASSGKNAKLYAAKKALGIIKGKVPYEFRKEFGCDCEVGKKIADETAVMEAVGTAI